MNSRINRPDAPWAPPSHSRVERRMAVQTILSQRDGPIGLAALVTRLLKRPTVGVSAMIDGMEMADWIGIQLHHVDLPYLESKGVLRYDPSRRVVTKCRP